VATRIVNGISRRAHDGDAATGSGEIRVHGGPPLATADHSGTAIGHGMSTANHGFTRQDD